MKRRGFLCQSIIAMPVGEKEKQEERKRIWEVIGKDCVFFSGSEDLIFLVGPRTECG
jgi:hypothetical protein